MIEQYPWILDYGISPSCPNPSLVSTGAVVGSEGTLNMPKPVPQKDEVNGQTTGRPGTSGHPRVNGRQIQERR